MLVFYEGGGTGEPREKPSKRRRQPTGTQPTYASGLGIEVEPHWWKANALITAPLPDFKINTS